MSTWFYYDSQGQKQGPVTGGQLKGLAKAGRITPETVVETEDGKTAPARKVKGLTFIEAAQPEIPLSAGSNTFTAEEQAEIDKFCNRFYELYGTDLKKIEEKTGSTSLHLASIGWCGVGVAVVRFLVSQGVDIHAKDHKGETPLHATVHWGNTKNAEVAKFLISQGAKVNARDNSGNTPLWLAATGTMNKNIEVLEVLISSGADVNERNEKGESLLYKTLHRPGKKEEVLWQNLWVGFRFF